jgi:hypothetical protein
MMNACFVMAHSENYDDIDNARSVMKWAANNWFKEYGRIETTAFDKGSFGPSNGCRRDET